MKNEDLLSKILKKTYTKKDFYSRLRLLREYLEKGFFTSEKRDLTKFLLSKRATTDDINSFLSWGDNFFQSFTHDNMYKNLEYISDSMKKLPVVAFYIPYEPVPAEINKLGKWFRRNVGDRVVLDIKTDQTLLGGCAFAWKGTYRDYSLRYYMRKKSEEISKLVSEYVKKFYQN